MSIPGNRGTPPDPPDSRPPDPTRLLLVRHGQSTWNEQGRIQGQLDPPLSELGHEQARMLAERLSGGTFAGFYTSDLSRTAETAAAIGEVIGLPPVARPQLREVGLGAWEGMTAAEVAEQYPAEWERWRAMPSWDSVPEAEGSARFETRVRGAIADLFEHHPHGDVLVVTHGGVIQVALGDVVGRTGSALEPFVIDNCSLSTIVRGPRRTVITGVNDVSHLATANGLLTSGRRHSGGLRGSL
jgi:probable phosphoglycerate mutase